MSGDIGITAKFRIITKAKLDSIRKYSSSKRPQVVRMVRLESTGQGLVRTRFGPITSGPEVYFSYSEYEKVLSEIVNAMDQKKKMKFMILFSLLMAQDWFLYSVLHVD